MKHTDQFEDHRPKSSGWAARVTRSALCALAVATAGACSTTSDVADRGEPARVAGTGQVFTPGDGEALLFDAHPDAAIPPGKCGLVLWTLDDREPRPVFRHLVGDDADAMLDGARASFALVDAKGASRFGVSEHQVFEDQDGLQAVVRVSFGLGFEGGIYVQEGIITMLAPDGWRTVTPAAGLIGCRRKI